MIQPNGLCPHKQNPRACLTCFHAPKPAAAKPAVPTVGFGGIPLGAIPGPGVLNPAGYRPGQAVGERVSGQPAVSPEERARHRGERPGAQQSPGAAAPMAPPSGFSSTEDNGASYNPDVLWEPPKRPEIIDRLPSHPEAGRMR